MLDSSATREAVMALCYTNGSAQGVLHVIHYTCCYLEPYDDTHATDAATEGHFAR